MTKIKLPSCYSVYKVLTIIYLPVLVYCKNKLSLRNDIGALDFNLGCSGYIYGFALADSLIKSGIANNVLFITSETYSKNINSEDKSSRSIFGDGNSAELIIDAIINSKDASKYKKK